jgi:hypothetical protein
VEPHVEGNPEVVLSTIRTVVESALQARLDEPFGASVISLIQLAVSRNLLNPDVASQLNAHLTNPSADFQTADAVTLVVLAIHALGGSRTVTRYGAAGSSHRSLR